MNVWLVSKLQKFSFAVRFNLMVTQYVNYYVLRKLLRNRLIQSYVNTSETIEVEISINHVKISILKAITARKMKFPLRISSVNVADLVTFTEEILNGKLHFLCSAYFTWIWAK